MKILDYFGVFILFIGLVAVAIAFSLERGSFLHAIQEWAARDLEVRVELAAESLREPLERGDFYRVHIIGQSYEMNDVRLQVKSGGAVVFDSQPRGCSERQLICRSASCGGYDVILGIPLERVIAPFKRSTFSIVLAAVLSGIGVLLVFLLTYRQRIRIRELRRLEKFRREFIADFSHELKTPITGILGAVDLLDGNRTLVDLIKRESLRLNSLAGQILDLSRLEHDGAVLNREDTDVAVLLGEIISRYPNIMLKGIERANGLVMSVDAQLLDRAVSNLIENAVRHSQSNDIILEVDIKGRYLLLAVEDHGIGIPAEERERVFERFHRIDPSREGSTGGTGLGLAIVRSIARLHGGDVRLHEAKPSGCRFEISIPLTKR